MSGTTINIQIQWRTSPQPAWKQLRPKSRLLAALMVLLAMQSVVRLRSVQPESPALTVQGEVDNPLQLKLADLQSMPRVKIRARDHDGEDAIFEGVALWEIIKRAGPRLGKKHGGAAGLYVAVKAADDYQAVFALAEIDPDFTDRKIILADRCNDSPIPAAQGPLRVVVPEEKTHARWVRQVIALKVGFPGKENNN